MRLWLLLLVAANPGCKCVEVQPEGGPAISTPFRDDFNRASLGADWNATDPAAWRIVDGELVVRGAHNHPLWLTRPLPRDATIELDCWSNDDAGDLKVEAWGDGRSQATQASYTSTSYNFIFGGWHNRVSVLARLDEHGADRRERTQPRVEKGRRYHWTIDRRGGHIDWQIDGQPFLSFDDPAPLDGPDHRHFAFNNWEAELHFDNLVITPK
jgi:hypothetical protein